MKIQTVEQFAKNIVANAIASGKDWPVDAVFRIQYGYSVNGPYGIDQVKFVNSQEEVDRIWNSVANAAAYSPVPLRMTVEEWDLGPNLVRDCTFTRTTQVDNLKAEQAN